MAHLSIRTPIALTAAVLVLTSCTLPDTTEPQPVTTTTKASPGVGQTIAPGSPFPKGNLVPNVVGKVHQDAQDALQAAGFYNLAEEDSTGQGRMLVNDRNWVVVEQVPAAGTVLDPTKRVLLRSRKHADK